MSVGKKSQGSILSIGTTVADPSGDTFVVINGPKSYTGFGPQAPIIDATELADTARTKLKGIADFGDIEVTGNRNYGDAGQTNLELAARAAEDLGYNFELEFDDQITPTTGNKTKISFKAIVSSFRTNPGETDGLIEWTATLAVTGATTEVIAT